jgi:putative transposase
MILQLIDEAVKGGARIQRACKELGLSGRTIERWRIGKQDDERSMASKPRPRPLNKLSDEERKRVISIANSKEYRDLSPNQIVPLLADKGEYVASERTMYRILREENLQRHRERAKQPTRHKPSEHIANGPCQVWSWDITYLKSLVRGEFFYLYMFVDVWSRKIVGWEVHDTENAELSSQLFVQICAAEKLNPLGLVVHADNGGPMKGSTMVATLERLGVLPSFSRPRVSDDNPFSESLFRTMKYRPEYPDKPFASIDAVREWVMQFVDWYNNRHLHSAIRFVTPADRHAGLDVEKLARRKHVYEKARCTTPNRWSSSTRNWERPKDVRLNPLKSPRREPSMAATAAIIDAKQPQRSALSPEGPQRSGGGAERALTGPERRLLASPLWNEKGTIAA